MIKIGVSSCFLYPDLNRTVFSPKTLCYLERDMARYLARDGVYPILIPDLEEDEFYDFISQMDGFVFQGGSDLSPESYNEPHLNKDRWPGDLHRDQYELKIMEYAFTNEVPVFGICRGAQLINTYFGGTLYQDIEQQVETTVEHRHAVKYDHVIHQIDFTPESYLQKIYPNLKEATINSVHHQAVKDLGKDLIVDALSKEDHIIEAFHYKDMKNHFVLAVQWHPEFSHTLKEKVLDPNPLYDHFLDHVFKRKDS